MAIGSVRDTCNSKKPVGPINASFVIRVFRKVISWACGGEHNALESIHNHQFLFRRWRAK